MQFTAYSKTQRCKGESPRAQTDTHVDAWKDYFLGYVATKKAVKRKRREAREEEGLFVGRREEEGEDDNAAQRGLEEVLKASR